MAQRDEDIGRVEADEVGVKRIQEVITATNAVKDELEEVKEQLKNIKLAQDLILGQEVGETA